MSDDKLSELRISLQEKLRESRSTSALRVIRAETWLTVYHSPWISKISNRGGWQSESKKIFTSEGFDKFSNYIVPSITELLKSYKISNEIKIVQMWLNINGPNSYNVCHRHPGSDISGVLWIKQTTESGRFVFDNLDNFNEILNVSIDPYYLKEKDMY